MVVIFPVSGIRRHESQFFNSRHVHFRVSGVVIPADFFGCKKECIIAVDFKNSRSFASCFRIDAVISREFFKVSGQIIIHKAYKPDFILGFFNPHGLASKGLGEIYFFTSVTEATTESNNVGCVMSRILDIR